MKTPVECAALALARSLMVELGPSCPDVGLGDRLLALVRSARLEMLDKVLMTLLSDRETAHQRDEWAPVLKRLHDAEEAKC